MKLKIINRLASMGLGDKGFISVLTKGSLSLIAENETEEKMLSDIENTVTSKINKLSKTHDVSIDKKETRDTRTLRKYTLKFLDFKEATGSSTKVMIKHRQAVEYLLIFFGEKKIIKNITNEEANNFQLFLMKVPKNWKIQKDLKDKNLKLLIEKNSKLLLKYDKQMLSTVMAVVKLVNEMFNYFVDNTYIYLNPFKQLTKTKRVKSDKRNFKVNELKRVFQYIEKENMREEYIFLKFLLYTGLRRGEAISITKADIDFEKCMIDIDGTKTLNAKRIAVIHKDIKEELIEQLQDKSDTDLLFYNGNKNAKSRAEIIGNNLNDILKSVLGEELKKILDLHSLRKTFSQVLYESSHFDDLSLKTLMGHSTNNDVTDTHYLRGKRDYKTLKEKIDKVDFSPYFQ